MILYIRIYSLFCMVNLRKPLKDTPKGPMTPLFFQHMQLKKKVQVICYPADLVCISFWIGFKKGQHESIIHWTGCRQRKWVKYVQLITIYKLVVLVHQTPL